MHPRLHKKNSLPRYVAKRMLLVFFAWYCAIFPVSAIVNAQDEVSIRSTIWEQVSGAVMGNTELKAEADIAAYRAAATVSLERQYGLTVALGGTHCRPGLALDAAEFG